MKSKKVIATTVCGLCMVMGLSMTSLADSRKVVTLGANLTESQKTMMLNYFGVNENQVEILTITNQDERDHLSAFVPLEQIGTRTFSCAYVMPTTSGGIQVKTANLNWVTCNMIASTLSTSGVKNCQVIAASPIEVSGTGALTGIIMAYESANGEQLEESKKQLANEELYVTGTLSDEIGQKAATAVINETKMQVISQNITNTQEINNIIIEATQNNNVSITQEQQDEIAALMEKIAEESYDYADMQDTLAMVEENVSENPITDLIETERNVDQPGDENFGGDIIETEPEENILDNTNEDALGEGVITGSTQEPETEESEIPAIVDPDITEQETGTPEIEDPFGEVQTENYYTEETETPPDAVHYTEDDLIDEEDKKDYKDTMEFFDKLFSPDKIVEEGDYKVYVPQEIADELKDDIGQHLLDLMINGAKIDTLEYLEYDEETEVYTDLELKDMIKFVRKLLRDDDKEIMPADVTTEDKEFWYEEAKEWFEDLYDYIPEGEMEIFDPELSAEETGVEDGMIDLGPVETEVFTVE